MDIWLGSSWDGNMIGVMLARAETGTEELDANDRVPSVTEMVMTYSMHQALWDVILSALDVQEDDFDPSVPLTSYGLDSISAGRLSQALSPLIRITQLQPFAIVSLQDLEKRLPADTAEKLAVRDNPIKSEQPV
ncbi:hypothetical protein CPC08DRAFT_771327 [Agrocybe pediades]|nr:hypothetical protein CPC08DRAFT_771327 [Agrocybe pediades]